MLMSASTNEALTIHERLFDELARHARRPRQRHDRHPHRPRLALRRVARRGRSARRASTTSSAATSTARPRSGPLGANLGLYSVTFNNDPAHDLATLERYHEFRAEAERKGFRYFLEVFDPNVPDAVAPDMLPGFINDMIARTLAGVAPAGRPLFLKMVYHGPKAMEELVRYDPHLVVGILGGSAGTTYDAFKLLAEAQKYGARVALFGRKINNAENQLAFVRFLRLIVDGEIGPDEAVKAYHAVLRQAGHPAAPLARRRPEAPDRGDELRRELDLRDRPAEVAGVRARRTPTGRRARLPVSHPRTLTRGAKSQSTSAPVGLVQRKTPPTASPPPPTAAPTSAGWMWPNVSRITASGWDSDAERGSLPVLG